MDQGEDGVPADGANEPHRDAPLVTRRRRRSADRGLRDFHWIRNKAGELLWLLTYDDDPRIDRGPDHDDGNHGVEDSGGFTGGDADSWARIPEWIQDQIIGASIEREERVARLLPSIDLIDVYLEPFSTVSNFNSIFPLPGHLFSRWKNGIRLWPTKSSSVQPYRKCESDAMDLAVNRMLSANIIKASKKGPFVSNIFFVPKGKSSIRPVIDYSHLTNFLPVPKMHLPNIFQLIDKYEWEPGLFYIKLDFSAAFFNIPLHEKSKYVTCFRYKSEYYVFNRLPFGISIAPYAMQQFLNCIVNFIRRFTKFCWGHIDDIIIGHKDPEVLRGIFAKLEPLLTLVSWRLNPEKSVTEPTPEVKFLGSMWGPDKVVRTKEASRNLIQVLKAIQYIRLTGRPLQRVRGYLNYYLSFGGRFFSYVNRVIMLENKTPYLRKLLKIAAKDSIVFKKKRLKKEATIASDATLHQLAAISIDFPHIYAVKITSSLSILMNELKASFLAISLFQIHFINSGYNHLLIRIDNKAVVSLWNKGRCKWRIDLTDLYKILYKIDKYKRRYNITAAYIPSDSNPADALSRRRWDVDLGKQFVSRGQI